MAVNLQGSVTIGTNTLWRFAYELIDLRFFRVIMKSYLGSTQKSCGSSKRQAAYP
jgi:hypothetical protein